MGGSLDALAYGVGATEYAALALVGLHVRGGAGVDPLRAHGRAAAPACTAKDVMLYILANHARRQHTLDRVMEFGGPGLASLSPDERATLANMATECSAKAGVVEADEAMLRVDRGAPSGHGRRGAAARTVVARPGRRPTPAACT